MKHVYNNLSKLNLVLILLISLLATSCKKDNADRARVIKGTKGVYMLCEGLMGDNNSALSYYDIQKNTTEVDYFKKVNGRPLGETANDLKAYGSKMYCVVAGIQGKKQSFLEIIDIASCKSLKTISFNSDVDGYIPRYVAFYKDKAYVSRYDGKITRIDTATMAIDGELQLLNADDEPAGGLEGLAVADGKLYVTNSVHPFYPNGLKDKVTVIDLESFKKLRDITVGYNPVKIVASSNGSLIVVSWGNYDDIAPETKRINSATDGVTGNYTYNVGPLAVHNNTAYLITDWNSAIKSFNVSKGILGSDFITDGTQINTMYGVTINSFDESVVIADANNYNSSTGHAYGFNASGHKIYDFATAGLPQHAVFVYNYK